MAETTKKAKAPSKAKKAETEKVETATAESEKAPGKKAALKKGGVAIEAAAAPAEVRHEDVAQLAHKYWRERGHHHGQHVDDWFRAEQELRNKAS